MLEALKFVQGAVGKRDFIPALTHFRIKDSAITSYNGTLALSAPIDCDIDCIPKAVPFFKAIQRCRDTVSMHMTDAGRLAIKSGAFKVYIDCISEIVNTVEPEGEFPTEFDGSTLMEALDIVQPIIGTDASRPWATGALLDGTSVFATNNVIIVEAFTATKFPFRCNLPGATVKELLRIGEAPASVQGNDTSITFHYEGGGWLKTQLFSTEWPDVAKILGAPCNLTPVDDRIFEALEDLKPFVGEYGRVALEEGSISTSEAEGTGATVEVEDLEVHAAFNLDMLYLLNNIAETTDFTTHPRPCLFQGHNLRGAIIGMR